VLMFYLFRTALARWRAAHLETSKEKVSNLFFDEVSHCTLLAVCFVLFTLLIIINLLLTMEAVWLD